MANETQRFYIAKGGQHEDVTEATVNDATAMSSDVNIDIKRATLMTRSEVIQAIENAVARIAETTWPPA